MMRTIQGVEDLGLFRVIGQPNLNFTVDRDKAARYQINVADVQDAIQTAVGGNALTQVLQGEQRYDLVLRYLPQYRDTKEAIENIRLLSPSGERVSLAQLTDVRDGGRRRRNLSRRQPALCRHQVRRARARSRQHGGRGHQEGDRAGQAAGRIHHQLGRRIRQPAARAAPADADHSADAAADLLHSLHHVQFDEVGRPGADERRHGSGGRAAGAALDRDEFQRVVRRRIPGAVRSIGADRRHHGGVHEPVARRAAIPSWTRPRRARCCASGPS